MNRSLKQLLYWTPRVLGILYAAFISMFALDVFSEACGFWPTTIALLMHLIPTAIILIVLAISWRWEWVGALLFTAVGLAYTFKTLQHPHLAPMIKLNWILFIAGPLFLIGGLFFINWLCRKHPREKDCRRE
jgi:hypothetical protein